MIFMNFCENDKAEFSLKKKPKVTTNKLFEPHIYSSPMTLLNACIQNLSKQHFDIRKVAIFEEPPQAILHIKKNERDKPKVSWRSRFQKFETTENSVTRVKLYVTKETGSKAAFNLNYEIMPSVLNSK